LVEKSGNPGAALPLTAETIEQLLGWFLGRKEDLDLLPGANLTKIHSGRYMCKKFGHGFALEFCNKFRRENLTKCYPTNVDKVLGFNDR
jgi:hypothetical protein